MKHLNRDLVGQDMHVGYSAGDGIHYELFVCEGLVLRVDEPQAICVLLAEQTSALDVGTADLSSERRAQPRTRRETVTA